jgi:hypothetical protein
MTEIEITAGLIRDLLQDQHPELAELPIREVEGGWGNQMWRLGDELAVRIQRMETEPDRQLKERRWLPLLAPRLPLDRRSITRSEHAADTLAAFLRALHVAAPANASVGTGRSAHPKDCTDAFDQFFDSVDADGCYRLRRTVRRRPGGRLDAAAGGRDQTLLRRILGG